MTFSLMQGHRLSYLCHYLFIHEFIHKMYSSSTQRHSCLISVKLFYFCRDLIFLFIQLTNNTLGHNNASQEHLWNSLWHNAILPFTPRCPHRVLKLEKLKNHLSCIVKVAGKVRYLTVPLDGYLLALFYYMVPARLASTLLAFFGFPLRKKVPGTC